LPHYDERAIQRLRLTAGLVVVRPSGDPHTLRRGRGLTSHSIRSAVLRGASHPVDRGARPCKSTISPVTSERPPRRHYKRRHRRARRPVIRGSLNKRIPDGEAALNHLSVLEILGIERVALGLERRCSDQTVTQAIAVLRCDPPAGIMSVDRQGHRRGTQYSNRGTRQPARKPFPSEPQIRHPRNAIPTRSLARHHPISGR